MLVLVLVDPGLVLLHPGVQDVPQLVCVKGNRGQVDCELLRLHWILLVIVLLLGDVNLALNVWGHLEWFRLTDHQVCPHTSRSRRAIVLSVVTVVTVADSPWLLYGHLAQLLDVGFDAVQLLDLVKDCEEVCAVLESSLVSTLAVFYLR